VIGYVFPRFFCIGTGSSTMKLLLLGELGTGDVNCVPPIGFLFYFLDVVMFKAAEV